MSDEKRVKGELFRDLKFLVEDRFPKKCRICGKVYEKAGDFLSDTLPLGNTGGLKETTGDDDEVIVELFRNCVCGTTFMEECKDRRDMSKAGKRKRDVFAKILALLKSDGCDEEVAIKELKRVMRGGDSEFLRAHGLDLSKLRIRDV